MYGERAHTLLRCFTCRASWWWCIGVMAPKRKSREVNSATLPIVHGFSRSGTNLLKTPLALDKTSLLSFSVSQTTESGAKANLKTEFVLIRNCVVESTFFLFQQRKTTPLRIVKTSSSPTVPNEETTFICHFVHSINPNSTQCIKTTPTSPHTIPQSTGRSDPGPVDRVPRFYALTEHQHNHRGWA